MTTLPFETADLHIRSTIEDIVRVYQTEIQNIRSAYATLKRAGQNITLAFGKETTYSDISALPRQCHTVESAVEEVERELRSTCWNRLIAQLGVRKVLSISRNEELSKKLDDKKNLPEITVETVFETFDLLVGNANGFAKEAILEVYNALHVSVVNPGDYNYQNRLKTNQKNATEDLGKKIILTGTVRVSYSGDGYQVQYGRQTDKLTALDKVFHNLDGEPFNDSGYTCPLVDAINTCGPAGKGETEYFKFKCYQNGNLHLEFKHLDLLKEFNRAANDGTELKSGRIF